MAAQDTHQASAQALAAACQAMYADYLAAQGDSEAE